MVRDHRIETYDFQPGSVVGASFNAYTWRQVNGILLGVQLKENNYAATGSLALTVSGLEYPLWSLISGTATGNTAQSGVFYPVAYPVNQINVSLSGTAPIVTEIPLFGNLHLNGAGLGASKSGLGITLVYKMG
jgi:hypothetical protein